MLGGLDWAKQPVPVNRLLVLFDAISGLVRASISEVLNSHCDENVWRGVANDRAGSEAKEKRIRTIFFISRWSITDAVKPNQRNL
jgi:hypothetical protein